MVPHALIGVTGAVPPELADTVPTVNWPSAFTCPLMQRFCPTAMVVPVRLELTPIGSNEPPIEMNPVVLGDEARYEFTLPQITTGELKFGVSVPLTMCAGVCVFCCPTKQRSWPICVD